MYFEDLTIYEYFNEFINSQTLNVGWLDAKHSFKREQSSSDFLDKLFQMCLYSLNKSRGYHQCPFCTKSPWGLKVERRGQKAILGGAEIRVKGLNDKIYAAPDLIYHYVEAHNYSPPEEFIKAVLAN